MSKLKLIKGYPKQEVVDFYHCSNCGKNFQFGGTSCAVLHGKDECCHHLDTEVTVVLEKKGFSHE